MKDRRKRKQFLLMLTWVLWSVLGCLGFKATVAHAETYGDFEYTVLVDNTVEITAYKGNKDTIVIPATINSKAVTSIGRSSFEFCKLIKAVTIPNTVKRIGSYAFYGCNRLTSVTFPSGLISIGRYAFGTCYRLNEVILPPGVKTIEGYAFFNCEGLSDITIPDSVTYIGEQAFYATSWLAKKRNENPLVMVNHILLDGNTCTGKVVIPDSITFIAPNAFWYCEGMTEVVIPESVEYIGATAFIGCENLTSVTIPDGVTVIDRQTFYNCKNLTNVVIPGSVTAIGEKAFLKCPNLTSITMPGNIASIGADAFDKSTVVKVPGGSHTEVLLSEQGYSYVTIPSVTVTFHTNGGSAVQTQKVAQGIRATRPENPIKTDYLFTGWYTDKGCTKPYHFDKAVDSNLTLYAGWKVRDLKLNETIKIKGVTYRVINPSAKAVQYCGPAKRTAKTATIPATVSFHEIPYKVTSIQKDAFKNCKKLNKVTVGKNITAIGSNAFYGCKKLKTVTFKGKTVKTIGEGAFRNCTILKKVTIPKAVTSIGKNAFRNCKKLSSINIKSTTLKKVGAKAFTGIHKKAKFTVPKKKLKAYKRLLTKKTGYRTGMKIKK